MSNLFLGQCFCFRQLIHEGLLTNIFFCIITFFKFRLSCNFQVLLLLVENKYRFETALSKLFYIGWKRGYIVEKPKRGGGYSLPVFICDSSDPVCCHEAFDLCYSGFLLRKKERIKHIVDDIAKK